MYTKGFLPVFIDPFIGYDAPNDEGYAGVYPSDLVIQTESEHPGVDYTNLWILAGILAVAVVFGRKRK